MNERCPRCQGRLLFDEDRLTYFKYCLACGYRQYLKPKFSSLPKPSLPPGPLPSPQVGWSDSVGVSKDNLVNGFPREIEKIE
jgi:hypothetical protein